MQQRRAARYRRRRRLDEQVGESRSSSAPAGAARQPERLGPLYDAGPVYDLAPQRESGPAAAPAGEPGQATPAASSTAEQEEQAPALANGAAPKEQSQTARGPIPGSAEELIPALAGVGTPEQVAAFNQTGPLRLQGRTDATYDGGQYHTANVTVRPGRGCGDCGECINASGTLVATYAVATSVTLPSVSDFPGLTPCQQQRVQRAIGNILTPHEQQHVTAFHQYNGTTRRAFNVTVCRTQFERTIQSMFEAEESARRQAAQAASDALDPFHFDVDMDCDEPQQPRRQTTGAAAAPPTEE